MAKMIYSDIADALKQGREFEFSFNKKKYSITNSNGFWVLCCDTDTPTLLQTICAATERELLPEKVQTILIDGVFMSDIFDKGKYDENSLYIL